MSDLDVPLEAHWWKLLLVGGCTLTGLIVMTTITGELPDGWWVVAMTTLLFSILAVAAGIVLGAAHLLRRGATKHEGHTLEGHG